MKSRSTARSAAFALLVSAVLAAPAAAQDPPPDSTATTAPDTTAVTPDSVAVPAAEPSDAASDVQAPEASIPQQASDSQDEAPVDLNPFEGFETHFLSNGVKLWFKPWPGATDVSVSVSIPYGSDNDPEGLEELAHFTEHMLFSDHRGMTEAEIKEAIEGRGGVRNGITRPDQTFYYAHVAREHGLFALEWLARLVEPHAMDPAIVERNKEPVANELNVRPRELIDHVDALLNPGWLKRPGYWKREFGLDTRSDRSYDRWANLQAIRSEDLQAFYETHYVPSKMTVTVIGDLERDEVLGVAQSTFGSLLPRAASVEQPQATDPGRGRTTYSFGPRSNVNLLRTYKAFSPSAEDRLRMEYIADLLSRRLNQELRYGERKAVYSIGANVTTRASGAALSIRSRIDEEDVDFALEVIDREIAALVEGSRSTFEFEEDRAALIGTLQNRYSTPSDLASWSNRVFYDPDTYRDFPDVVAFYAGLDQDELADFAAELFVPERTVQTLDQPLPVDQGLLALAVVLLVWLTFGVTRFALTTKIQMPDIKYVARFKTPLPLGILRVAVFTAVGVFAFRLLFFGFDWTSARWILPMSDYWAQAGAFAGMGVLTIVLGVVYLSRIPRKLLVFSDHIRVKSAAYRSRILVPEEVAEISLKRMPGVWLGKLAAKTSLLSFGLIKPAIHLRPHEGRGYYFRSRDTDELMALLQAWWGGRGAEPVAKAEAAPKEPPPPDDSPRPKPPEEPLDIDSLDIDDPELEALLRADP